MRRQLPLVFLSLLLPLLPAAAHASPWCEWVPGETRAFEEGDAVMVYYAKHWYPGHVENIDGDDYEVSFDDKSSRADQQTWNQHVIRSALRTRVLKLAGPGAGLPWQPGGAGPFFANSEVLVQVGSAWCPAKVLSFEKDDEDVEYEVEWEVTGIRMKVEDAKLIRARTPRPPLTPEMEQVTEAYPNGRPPPGADGPPQVAPAVAQANGNVDESGRVQQPSVNGDVKLLYGFASSVRHAATGGFDLGAGVHASAGGSIARFFSKKRNGLKFSDWLEMSGALGLRSPATTGNEVSGVFDHVLLRFNIAGAFQFTYVEPARERYLRLGLREFVDTVLGGWQGWMQLAATAGTRSRDFCAEVGLGLSPSQVAGTGFFDGGLFTAAAAIPYSDVQLIGLRLNWIPSDKFGSLVQLDLEWTPRF